MKTLWNLVQGYKTWIGIVIVGIGAMVGAAGTVLGLPLETTAEWLKGIGLMMATVGAADKIRRGA